MSTSSEIRRQLGSGATGPYDMRDMQFSVREIEPPKAEEEPSTVPTIFGDDDCDGSD